MLKMRLTVVATCSLNQWAMDFVGNVKRVIESIEKAKELGASYRIGPELEITGYSCEDHFLESDTVMHAWEGLVAILATPGLTDGILCLYHSLPPLKDIGMPVLHGSARYNCRVFVLNGKILLIRPKMALADDGNYQFILPPFVRAATGQVRVPIGDGVVQTLDTCIGSEMCEELWTVSSTHIRMGLNGVEIFSNGSGSHHVLKKLHSRVDLMRMATAKTGGVYMYANQQGCDGGRVYFDGCALIVVNGNVVAQGSQFSMRDVEVISAVIDLDAIASYRCSHGSMAIQATTAPSLPRIQVDFSLTELDSDMFRTRCNSGASPPVSVEYHTVEQEICFGPSCWLWDYLRRSRAGGFFLPLSGGIDSSATATIVGAMCSIVLEECEAGNKQVIDDVRRITGRGGDWLPSSPRELASILFHTCYMGSENSSKETRDRAKSLANEIGSYHMNTNIDSFVQAGIAVFTSMFSGLVPKFRAHGGTRSENLALQNIQARCRMVLAYLFSSLLPWARFHTEKREHIGGFLLVLGSANVDESLRGYMTKYDCSSADINPIGGISKADLRKFIKWASEEGDVSFDPSVSMISSGETCSTSKPVLFTALRDILTATPTAELEPITESYVQSDEEDMGMTYDELSLYGSLRKIKRCGPVSMFRALLSKWSWLSPSVVAEKVKHFFVCYGINRHKMTTVTPAYHAEAYSPDDNRFDLRPFLYPDWKWQFTSIDRQVLQMKGLRAKASI